VEKIAVMPRGNAFWAALGELPAAAADAFSRLLEAHCRARQVWLASVLDKYGVPVHFRDVKNVLVGLKDIEYKTPHPAQCHSKDASKCYSWTFKGERVASLSEALQLWRVQEGDSEPFVVAVVEHDDASADVPSEPRSELVVSDATTACEQLAAALLQHMPADAVDDAVPREAHGGARKAKGARMHFDEVTQITHAQMRARVPSLHPGVSLSPSIWPTRTASEDPIWGIPEDDAVLVAATGGRDGEQATPRQRQSLPKPTRPNPERLAAYLVFFGDGSSELDPLHAQLSGAVLDVFASWHGENCRLRSQRPDGVTDAQLRDVKNATYRLPFDVLVSVACFAVKRKHLMRGGAARGDANVAIADPGGHRDRTERRGQNDAHLTNAVSFVARMKTALAHHPGGAKFFDTSIVETAYSHARRELGQQTRRHALPLIKDRRNDILRQCGDLTQPRDVRCATWTVNAPILMQRTCESVSQLHADLEVEPHETIGCWHVPGFTKTTDGVEGRVGTWAHAPGCKHRSLALHDALELPTNELRAAACSPGVDGRLSIDKACPVCLCWLSRKMQGLGASPREGVHPLYQEVGVTGCFNGVVVDPDVLLLDLREKMSRADAERKAADLPPAFPELGQSLYMARHGGTCSDRSKMTRAQRWLTVCVECTCVRRHHAIPDGRQDARVGCRARSHPGGDADQVLSASQHSERRLRIQRAVLSRAAESRARAGALGRLACERR
jgi:hypothetical protein